MNTTNQSCNNATQRVVPVHVMTNNIANTNLSHKNDDHQESSLFPDSPAEQLLLLPSPGPGGYGGKHGSSQVPIAGALFVATCLGTPVIALTGLKLGMFAAVGGGIMGFATGKMFAEHE